MCIVSCGQPWRSSALSECFLLVRVAETDGATGRIYLLTYGCAYMKRSDDTLTHSSSSSNVLLQQERAPSCQSLSASMSTASLLFSSINHLQHDLSLGSDVSGRLCYCHTDNCNSAISTSFVRSSSWTQAFMCTILIFIFTF